MRRLSPLANTTIASPNAVRAILLAALLIALTVGALVSARLRQGASPTAGGPSVAQTFAGGDPLVSRDKPAICSSQSDLVAGPTSITSGKHGDWSFWSTAIEKLPAWCAIHVGAGPSRLMVVWYSDYEAFDYQQDAGDMPGAYTLSVSADSTNGADGSWSVVATVTGNRTRVREHVIPFAGQSWVKMTVTQGPAQPAQDAVTIDDIDCYDVSANLNDTVLFQGDSITAEAYNQFDASRPSFTDLIHRSQNALDPPMLDEGTGGWTSQDATGAIDQWLALNPDIHYWLLQWGTNDALEGTPPADFAARLRTLVNKIKAAGHIPVLAHVPAVSDATPAGAAVDQRIQSYNAEIDAITRADHLLAGPDMYTLFHSHESAYLSNDGIHPSSAGQQAMNAAWYDVMRHVLTQ